MGDTSGRERKKTKAAIILVFITLVVMVIAGIFIHRGYRDYQIKNETLQLQLQDIKSDIADRKVELASYITDVSKLLEGATEESVDDVSVLDTARDALEKAQEVVDANIGDVESGVLLGVMSEHEDLEKAITDGENLLKSVELSIDSLSYSYNELSDSIVSRKVADARDELSNLMLDATEKYAKSKGKVADEGVRSELEEYISLAKELLKSEDISESVVQSINNCISGIESSMESVDDSILKQEEIEKRQKELEEQNNREVSVSEAASSLESDTWFVEYTVGYHTYQLGEGVVKWEEGYYVAHNTNVNGQRIASCVPYVVVDGVKYKYVSKMTVPETSTWDEIQDFVLANGGIGFQTCVDDGYLVTHYEPV